MPEVRRDAERTRAELLAVATEVFAEDGYSGARVDEIAARTRTTKRMIYYYFGGKEGLYRAVLEEAYRGIREAERGIDVDHSDPVQAVRALAEVTFDHHVQHDAFIRLVAIENIHRGEFIRQIDGLREASKPAKDVLDEILQRGRDPLHLRAPVRRRSGGPCPARAPAVGHRRRRRRVAHLPRGLSRRHPRPC